MRVKQVSYLFGLGIILLAEIQTQAQCPAGDLFPDCRVDLKDLDILAACWLTDNPVAELDGKGGVYILKLTDFLAGS